MILGVFLIVLALVFIIAWVRSEITYSLKVYFLYDDMEKYDKLPEYEIMMFCYPHMWTKKQWVKWIEKEEQL